MYNTSSSILFLYDTHFNGKADNKMFMYDMMVIKIDIAEEFVTA